MKQKNPEDNTVDNNKRLEMMIERLNEINSDLDNIIGLSSDIKGLETNLKKFCSK